MVHGFNQALCALFELFFYPFRELNPWIGFAAASLLTAALMLLSYRFASNQQGIRATKDRIKAHLLEVRLYRDEPLTVLRAQWLLIRYNLRYLGYSFVPLLVMIVPLALILIQLDLRFGRRPLAPSETAILKMRLDPGLKPSTMDIALDAAAGIAPETPPLRIDAEAEVDWRVRAVKEGSHTLRAKVGREVVEMRVEVRRHGLVPLPAARVGRDWVGQILNPLEPPLADSSVARSIEVGYPARELRTFGADLHWLIPFFALSILLGVSLKGLFRVQI